ncbi:tetratricopeptide repeat protein [Clostridium gasigenes]|uniref:Uncharacterized protein n=1 Tax=Clostridium gasigenes TaxID=94869 RepID=A0A1H0MML7_9CLOT|nr:hypothetical protein [Clostridium gasigenes]MBU3086915.1 hypothetical protein [Clostridium gasigenes]SDO81390.1 hypothetical protein SAMN04488529_101505 [Clostridium gasigenes]
MDKFKLIIKRIGSKVKACYNVVCKKLPYIEPTLIIFGSLLVVLVILVSIKGALNGDVTTIEANQAEVAFYNNNYEQAITEYEKLQEGEEWPFWQVKIAEIHSIKGEIEKSNELLRKATLKRNKILSSKDRKKYETQDKEFINYVVFTYFMNEEYEQALSLGEQFIKDNGKDKTLMRTMYTVYMVDGQKDKAKEMIDNYEVDNESAYDLALIAKMNMLSDNWDDGFKLLNEAFNKDKNEIKVFDVITQFAAYDRDGILTKLTELVNDNPEELSYKMWLAKVYSMLPETTNLANDIIEEIKNEDVGEIPLKVMMSTVYKNTGNELEANSILENIINNDKNSYASYHIAAWQSFESENYDKAFELCKKSILANKDYPDNYGFLMPKIMMAKEKNKTSEGYFITALQKEPFNYNIMIKIAEYYEGNSIDNEKSRRYYRLAAAMNPNDSEIYYNLATLDLLDKNIDSAIKYLNKAIEINGAVSKYHRTLGTIYLNQGQNDKAIESIRIAYGEDKSDALTLNNAGCYYISIEGDIERGMDNIKGAYEGINNSMDEETKNTIIKNYHKAKTLYDEYNIENEAKLIVPEFSFFD